MTKPLHGAYALCIFVLWEDKSIKKRLAGADVDDDEARPSNNNLVERTPKVSIGIKLSGTTQPGQGAPIHKTTGVPCSQGAPLPPRTTARL